jgi:hypothetical protein
VSSTITDQRRSWLARVWGILRRRRDSPDDVIFLSRRDVRALLERRAREDFEMSAEEFLAAADRGDLKDSPLAQHLLLIAGERAGEERSRSATPI